MDSGCVPTILPQGEAAVGCCRHASCLIFHPALRLAFCCVVLYGMVTQKDSDCWASWQWNMFLTLCSSFPVLQAIPRHPSHRFRRERQVINKGFKVIIRVFGWSVRVGTFHIHFKCAPQGRPSRWSRLRQVHLPYISRAFSCI